jgi:hypothetical protein
MRTRPIAVVFNFNQTNETNDALGISQVLFVESTDDPPANFCRVG